MCTLLPLILCVWVVACTNLPRTPDCSSTKPGSYGGDGSSEHQAVSFRTVVNY